MYTCFGLSAILFISQSIFLYGFAVQKRRLSIEWTALMGFLNVAGAVVYASRVSYLSWKFLFFLVAATGLLMDNRFRSVGFRLGLTLWEPVIRSSMFWCWSRGWFIIELWLVVCMLLERRILFVWLCIRVFMKK
jgi:hypothetical protein